MTTPRFLDLRSRDRRNFLKWCTAAAALLGLERTRMLNVLSDTAGVAAADSLQTNMRRFVGIVAGNGGFSWFQLIWPHVDIAKSTDPNVAFHAMGQAIPAQGTTNPWIYAPESPFQQAGPNWQMTALMSGTNETHTSTPVSAASLASGVGMFAGIAADQKTRLSTLVPVVATQRMLASYQSADNSPSPAPVPNSDGVVSLFSSQASQRLLQKSDDARLYEATYKAFTALAASTQCNKNLAGYRTGQVASNVLGDNFTSQLTMSNDDMARYGVVGAPTALAAFAKDLWMALRLFQYDLSSMYLMTAFNDDPHGAFAGGDAMPQAHSKVLGQIFDAWRADAATIPDPSAPGLTLADNLVFTVSGDTPKTPLNRMGWPDGTPNGSNWVYAMGNGYLKTGWFGGVHADGTVSGWDPATGADKPGQQSSVTANAAAAAVYFATTAGMGDVVTATRGSVSNIAGVTFKNPLGKAT
jgi:hypothetical protein